MSHQVLDQPATGAVVRLRVGDTLEVRLTQRGGAGYRWTVAASAPLTVAGDKMMPPSTGAVGAAARRVLVFDARSSGRGELRLELARPWESGPLEVVAMEVDVI